MDIFIFPPSGAASLLGLSFLIKSRGGGSFTESTFHDSQYSAAQPTEDDLLRITRESDKMRMTPPDGGT